MSSGLMWRIATSRTMAAPLVYRLPLTVYRSRLFLLALRRILVQHFLVLDQRVRHRRPARVVADLDDELHDLLVRDADVLGAAVMRVGAVGPGQRDVARHRDE